MKAFHTSNRAPRNCWRVRLMWNNPVLRVMEYEALPRVFTMACGLFDDMPCLQPFPKPVLTYVSVCQARTLTHTNHEPSMRTESVGDQGKQALAADKSPESGDDFTEVSRSRRTDVQRSLMARIDCEKILVRRVSDDGAFESPSLSTH